MIENKFEIVVFEKNKLLIVLFFLTSRTKLKKKTLLKVLIKIKFNIVGLT